MKKNVMMRVASALLVAVLLTTCAISGTFAKYVTQAEASDVARVAKWGVELQVVGNLYGDTYTNTIVEDDNENMTVQSVNKADDLVAPGTKNEDGFSITLKGQPEVDGLITTTISTQSIFLAEGSYGVMVPVKAGVVTAINFDELGDLYYLNNNKYVYATTYAGNTDYYQLRETVTLNVDNDNNTNAAKYYPVVYTLAGTSTKTANTTYTEDSLAAVVAALKTALGSNGTTNESNGVSSYTVTTGFNSNDNLADVIKISDLALTWAWDFERTLADGTDEAKKAYTAMYDGADTILGYLQDTPDDYVIVKRSSAAGPSGTGDYVVVIAGTDYCLDTQFSIDITVEQVD